MNIYICSTVRHLLLALCKASQAPQTQHEILFFADYQQASLSNWDLSNLAENIHVRELSRSDLGQRVKSARFGSLIYLTAMRTLAAPAWMQQSIKRVLAATDPDLVAAIERQGKFNLWLFNERNHMARLFRLLSPDFYLIEDGETNYLKKPVPWWKVPSRLRHNLPISYRTFGDDPRCKEIWVNYPERLPELVAGKGCLIDFLEGDIVVRMIARVMGKNSIPSITTDTVILATQPLDGLAQMPVAYKQAIYCEIADYLEAQGRQLILKLHPAENTADYEFLRHRSQPAPAKVPIEALVLASGQNPVLLSVSSAAGLGFERFCQRIKLIENDDKETLRLWGKNPEKLKTFLDAKLKLK